MSITKDNILVFFFTSVVFILTRQVPFSNYSFIANICLFGLIILGISWNKEFHLTSSYNSIVIIIFWTILLFGYSVLVQDNNIGLATRFLAIVLCLFLAYWVKIPKSFIKIFFFFIIIQCLFLIILELYLILYLDLRSYIPLRLFFKSNNWGDIHSFYGGFYKIQLKGNALIPFAFYLTLLSDFTVKYKRLIQVVLLLGIIIAGNFAFLIATFLFISGWYIFRNLRKKEIIKRAIIYSIVIALLFGSILAFINDTMSKKDTSIGAREDQTELLITNLCDNATTLLFGKGLGNTIDINTQYRNYKDMVYYELQSLYFLNQLGLINFIIFIGLSTYLAIKKIVDKDLLFVYFCYIIYSVTNPYILDTNQVIVILVLTNLHIHRNRKKNTNENRLYHRSLSS